MCVHGFIGFKDGNSMEKSDEIGDLMEWKGFDRNFKICKKYLNCLKII